MIAYFVRRIVGGMATLFLAGLVTFTVVIYGPGGPKEYVNYILGPEFRGHMEGHLPERYMKMFNFDKPWPVSYLAWLFNPDDITYTKYEENGDVGVYAKGIDLFGIKGNGILTGDLGESINVDHGRSVVDVFGPGLGQFMLLLALLPFTALAFLVVQRRGRPSTNGLPNLPQSRKPFDQYLPTVRLPGL